MLTSWEPQGNKIQELWTLISQMSKQRKGFQGNTPKPVLPKPGTAAANRKEQSCSGGWRCAWTSPPGLNVTGAGKFKTQMRPKIPSAKWWWELQISEQKCAQRRKFFPNIWKEGLEWAVLTIFCFRHKEVSPVLPSATRMGWNTKLKENLMPLSHKRRVKEKGKQGDLWSCSRASKTSGAHQTY